MKSDGKAPAGTSVGGTTIRGRGSRTQALRTGDAVTSALSEIASGQTGTALPAGRVNIDRLKVRVPHGADAGQIRRTLARAIARATGADGDA